MSANERQVAGEHYKRPGKPQHWDLIIECFGGRYLEGCITKYLSRHARKDGRIDLEKAGHYLQKLMESPHCAPLNGLYRLPRHYDMINEFCADLPAPEARLFKALSEWGSKDDLRRCADWLDALIVLRYPAAARETQLMQPKPNPGGL